MGETGDKSHCDIESTAKDTNQELETGQSSELCLGQCNDLGSPTSSITWVKSSNTHIKASIFPGR